MLTYNMDARGRMAKYDYLYQSIKEDTLRALSDRGNGCPPSGRLAEHLGLSVVTVDAAYQQLVEEGYLYARERADIMPISLIAIRRAKSPPVAESN